MNLQLKLDTEVVKPFLCDYADAYILVTGDITVTNGDISTKVAFKNCHPFIKSVIRLTDERVEDSDNLDLITNMYSLIEYSENYSDFTPSLYQFKRQEPLTNNAALPNNSSSFKYKSDLLGKPNNQNDVGVVDGANPMWKNAQIIVPLKYISSFFRSLEMLLINTKLYIQLNYTKHSVISSGGGLGANDPSTFKITKTELYIPVVTLTTEDNNKLSELLDTEFERTVYWNEYKSKIETVTRAHNDNNYKTLLYTAVPEVNRLFVVGFNYNDALDADDEIRNNINTHACRVERNGYTK